jgi:hypothetical protein
MQQSADLRSCIYRHIDGYTLVIRVNNVYMYNYYQRALIYALCTIHCVQRQTAVGCWI